jgi:hypothetical protein
MSRIRRDSLSALRGPALPKGGNFLEVPEFIVNTASSAIVRVCMRESDPSQTILLQGSRRTVVTDKKNESVVVAAHPLKPLVVLASRTGLVQLVDIDTSLVCKGL